MDGCFAEYAVIPAVALYPLASDLAPEIACLLEPFGVSLRGARQGYLHIGNRFVHCILVAIANDTGDENRVVGQINASQVNVRVGTMGAVAHLISGD